MHDQVDVADRKTGLGKRRNHAEGLIVRRGRRLGYPDFAAIAPVDQDQVGKGPAHVDPGDDFAAFCAIFLNHARNPKCRT